MSLRERRIVSAMTPEAEELRKKREAEGLDPVSGLPACKGTDCGCRDSGPAALAARLRENGKKKGGSPEAGGGAA